MTDTRRGPGRPPIAEEVTRVTVRLDAVEVAKLDRMAAALQISRAEVIRRLIARRI